MPSRDYYYTFRKVSCVKILDIYNDDDVETMNVIVMTSTTNMKKLTKLIFCFISAVHICRQASTGTNMSSTKKNNNNKYLSAKPTFDHQVKGMEGFFFYYGKGMHAQASKTWPHAEGQMVNSKQFSADCMESINCGEITIIRMKEPQEYTDEAFNALSLKKQKMWDMSLKRWMAIEEVVGEEAR